MQIRLVRFTRVQSLIVLITSVTLTAPPNENHILGRHDGHGFRALWRKVKSPEKPDEVSLMGFEWGLSRAGIKLMRHYCRAFRLTRRTRCLIPL